MAFYSGAHARRSLWQFLAGKGAAATLGLLWLLWLVRTLPAAEYGTYVALVAVVEIFYLASGLGLSTLAQRYVAEHRIHAPARQFRRFVGGLLLWRLGFGVVGALLLALGLAPFLQWWGVALAPGAQAGFLAWLVAGSLSRYLDELFPALLLHGMSQGLALLGNALRLAFALVGGAAVASHAALVWLELALAVLNTGIGLLLLAAYLRRHPGAAEGVLHRQPAMWAVARRFYVVQLLGQAWSGNAARLVVSRLVGATATAGFGFCLALVEMLRNYLPAYLLANWLRPLMVARYLEQRSLVPVMQMANAVLKVSWLAVLPFAAFFASHGDALAGWISGGRYREGTGLLLVLLTLWAALQCLHVIVSMVTATLEQATPNLWATALACAALPLAVPLVPWAGAAAVAALLVLAEAAWVGFVLAWMHRRGQPLGFDAVGCGRIVVSTAAAALALALLPAAEGAWLLAPLIGACLMAWAGCLVLRPFAADELDLMQRVVPTRWRRW